MKHTYFFCDPVYNHYSQDNYHVLILERVQVIISSWECI
jgi:hypothetical protein